MEKLCEQLGYRFKDAKLLMTALTHPSFGGDHHVPHYQRLEFLGDAVLELAVSNYLYSELPEVDEGKLTRIRAALVREETLYRAAERIGLGSFIRLSVGEERSDRKSTRQNSSHWKQSRMPSSACRSFGREIPAAGTLAAHGHDAQL